MSDPEQDLINRRACPECEKLKRALNITMETLCKVIFWNGQLGKEWPDVQKAYDQAKAILEEPKHE